MEGPRSGGDRGCLLTGGPRSQGLFCSRVRGLRGEPLVKGGQGLLEKASRQCSEGTVSSLGGAYMCLIQGLAGGEEGVAIQVWLDRRWVSLGGQWKPVTKKNAEPLGKA